MGAGEGGGRAVGEEVGGDGHGRASNAKTRGGGAGVLVDGDRNAVDTRRERHEDLVRLELDEPEWRQS